RMLRGIDVLADLVTATLGPKGRTVLLDRRYGPPVATKDGVTVAKDVDLADHFANMGVQLVKRIADHVSDTAGDGTTTATILARSIFREGTRLVAAGHDPMSLKRGIDKAVGAALGKLARISKPVRGPKDVAAVAAIASNSDPEIGDVVARAFAKVGKEGLISVEDGRTLATELRFTPGLEFNRGWLSPQFVTDPVRMEANLENCLVVVSEKKLAGLEDVLPILTLIQRAKKPLLVIAEDVEGIALQTLVVNRMRGGLLCAAVKAPEFGDRRRDMLHDIATIVGARVLTEHTGLKAASLELEDLGRARQVIVERERTTIIDGAGSAAAIEQRLDHIRGLIRKTKAPLDREKLEERLATLLGGVAMIRVGGATEIDMKERKARYDDAICATRSALEEGIVAGGGVALLRAGAALELLSLPPEEAPAVGIVRRALGEPLRAIATNAGAEPSVVVERVSARNGAFGYNAATDGFEDLLEAGIVDPTKVVRIALQSAASIAGLLLTTEATLAE
ncbi:MAG: chaperonin GroEL, partial [Candidatus Binatia bacterium]